MTSPRPLPVLIDVDTGIDDAMALAVALRSPEFDVRAITCVGGNTSLENVVRNTLGVVALVAAAGAVGAAEIPVAAGLAGPLMSFAGDASHVHGANGLGGIELPTEGARRDELHAIERMRRELDRAREPLTIIALAPLTNIAVLLRSYPHLSERIARIVFMGGAMGPGNVTATAEFNTWSDPEAAEIVIRSGVPVTMYGLEPFYRTTLSADDIVSLRRAAEPLRSFVGEILAHTAATGINDWRIPDEGAATIGDAGVLCMLLEPGVAEVRELPVEVSLAAPTRGQTVVDQRAGMAPSAAATRIGVVTSIDGVRVREIFLSRL